jgi:membrane-associated phospholipid phosphatase
VNTGADWAYFSATRSSFFVYTLYPAAIIGGLFPILIPIVILLFAKSTRTKTLAWAIAQAELVAFLITSFIKIFTGRTQPNLANPTVDISHDFNFGFLHHGFFWGWPSSHTAVAVAMAVTVAYLRPKNKWLVWFAYAYALYIGIGVSVSIHWLSDFIAGALIGIVIGRVVARSFSRLSLS